MPKALPNHSPDTLRKYAVKVLDRAHRAFRKHPTAGSDAVVKTAMEAHRHAFELVCGHSSPSDFSFVARKINDASDSLVNLLAGRGEEWSL